MNNTSMPETTIPIGTLLELKHKAGNYDVLSSSLRKILGSDQSNEQKIKLLEEILNYV